MPTEIEKIQRTDHDTLIRVETKMDSLIIEMRSTNSAINDRLIDHESRLRVIEDIHSRVQPLDANKQLQSLLDWQDRLTSNYKFIAATMGGISILVGIASSFATIYFYLHR